MISLNLLDGTAPSYDNRKYGVSKRFLVTMGVVTVILSLGVFFLEVLFAAMHIGGGSLLSKEEPVQILVSQDEFSVINRQHATAPLVFITLINQTPRDANFRMMKLIGANKVIAQGYIASKSSGNAMFEKMRASGQWNVQNSQIYDKKSADEPYYKFQFTAQFIPLLDDDYSFKSAADFPPSDSVTQVLTKFSALGEALDFKEFKTPIIEKTLEGTTLFEYQYSMSSKSSYRVFHTFLTKVYKSGLPIIFEEVTLRPGTTGISADLKFRVLTN